MTFSEKHDNPPCLRQGDIIEGVFFPLPRVGTTHVLAAYEVGTETDIKVSKAEVSLSPLIDRPEGAKRDYLWANVQGFFCFAAVLSQCCDCDRKHPKTSLCLCRILKLDEKRFQNIENLRLNVDPYDSATRPHHQFFYYGALPGVEGEYIADFAHAISVPWADYPSTLNRKRLQLEDISRNKFRVKAGAWFGRPPEEDIKAGLVDPWHPKKEQSG